MIFINIYITYIYLAETMNSALFIVLFCLTCVSCITYPLFKQCDPEWGNHILGTSNETICKAGGLVSSVAMALNGATSHKFNPGSLNTWLK